MLITTLYIATSVVYAQEPELTQNEARSFRYKTERLNIALDSYRKPQAKEYASILALIQEIIDTEAQHHIMFPEELKTNLFERLGETPSISTVLGMLGLSCRYDHTFAVTEAYLASTPATERELIEARDNTAFMLAHGTEKKDDVPAHLRQEQAVAMQRCLDFYHFVDAMLVSK